MAQRPPQKGGQPRVRKLVMNITEDLLRQLKIRAAEQDTTVREIVTRAVQRELEKGGEGRKK